MREVVDLVDVAPTILELLGIPVPAAMQGRSLLAAMVDDSPAAAGPRPFVAESHSGRNVALRYGRWKLISSVWPWDRPASMAEAVTPPDSGWERAGARLRLYDLETDPGEGKDRLADEPFEARALQDMLAWELLRAAEVAESWSAGDQRYRPGADARSQLRELGYLE